MTGVHPGQIVALLMPHTELLAVAWLGALMRGAIPTILAEPSVRMPPAEYGHMLSHLFAYLSPAAAMTQGRRCSEAAGEPAGWDRNQNHRDGVHSKQC